MPPTDQDQRQAAVERHASLIVQAPAGSGKTSLLVQRYLRLLAQVSKPEAILAITFTRKAAAEMRNRILDALRAAASSPCPQTPHEAYSWRLARAAHEHGESLGWALLDNTGRLRVQTIDSLCADLARKVPLLSDMGALPEVTEDAYALYREAAEGALDPGDATTGAYVSILAEHLDGNFETLATLVINMLAQREQWLNYLGSSAMAPRDVLEASVRRLVDEALEVVRSRVPTTLYSGLEAVARHATYYKAHGTFDPDMPAPPAPDDDLPTWRAIAELMLTKGKGAKLRSRFDRGGGVPGPTTVEPAVRAFATEHQASVKALRDELAAITGAERALANVAQLPEPRFTEPEWSVLNAILAVLTRAVLELRLVFAAAGRVDFAEIQMRALQALGDPQGPSELALMMDYRIEHMLVDEFQDTSRAQVRLLERLTEGWQRDDGRTLFLVGDPMQSIYRFRQAEVGNFLRAQDVGIGQLALEQLRLTTNFRSDSNVVAWTNDAFTQIFPDEDNIDRGEIEFKRADAASQSESAPAVHVHAEVLPDGRHASDGKQSATVAALVARALDRHPHRSVAILVRARPHLSEVLPALTASGIDFKAVELEPLNAEQNILDLHALTLTLLQPDNVVAWLTILRAPWCGLTLVDLGALLSPADTFWLRRVLTGADDEHLNLSAAGRVRLGHIRDCYEAARRTLKQRRLRAVIEALWQDLGGPLYVAGDAAAGNIATYFEALGQSEQAGTLPDLGAFERRLDKLFAAPEPGAAERVQIMTMHKAKGLEFDTVIIPALERAPRPNQGDLLNWRERMDEHGQFSLLMAPIARDHHDHCGLYPLIQSHQSGLFDAEMVRLMYVAATRAKAELHLLGSVAWDNKKDAIRPPDSRTLLGKLWPVVSEHFEALGAPSADSTDNAAASATHGLLRLTSQALAHHHEARKAAAAAGSAGTDRLAPTEGTDADDLHAEAPADLTTLTDSASQTPRHIGTVVHRWLDRIASTGVETWEVGRIAGLRRPVELALTNMGVRAGELDAATAEVLTALENVLADDTGRWVLSRHEAAESELALSTGGGGATSNFVLDRTFVVDDERWIIDYKVSAPVDATAAGISAFIAQETQKYAPQLMTYARLMAAMERRPIRLALYFPLLQRMHSWVPEL